MLKKDKIIKFMKKYFFIAMKLFLVGHLILAIIIASLSIYVLHNNPTVTTLMLYREHFCGHTIEPTHFVPLENIPPNIISMVIAVEDYKFYEHYGIDVQMMKIAFYINNKVGYRMYGASTITMQLARTLFLFPKKLMIRKYVEVMLALGMELILPKERILELYLNYCELGNGIFGMPMAARHYFNKELHELSVEERTRLITIMPNPLDYNPNRFMEHRLLANRYYILKFRYYTYMKFNRPDR